MLSNRRSPRTSVRCDSSAPIRVLLAKPGLDGHDRGIKVVARTFLDAGMEVVYAGLRQTPEMIVAAAIQENADCIGLSILTGGHRLIVSRVMEQLRKQGAEDILVVLGGIIPEQDIADLKRAGVAEIFVPGTPLASAVAFVQQAALARSRRTRQAADSHPVASGRKVWTRLSLPMATAARSAAGAGLLAGASR